MALDLVLASVCTVLLGAGVTLQKHGLRDTFRASVKSRTWLAGVGLELCADGFYLGAASTEGARLTVIQPIVTLHFVVAMACAVGFLRERLDRRERIASAILVAGGALVLFSRSVAVDPDAAERNMTLALAAGALVVGLVIGVVAGRLRREEMARSIAAGLAFSGSVLATRVAGIDYRSAGGRVTTLLTASLAPWLVVAASIAGFVLVQLALKKGRAAVVSPVVAIVTLIVPVPIGVIVLRERAGFATFGGVALVTIGVVMLATPRAPAFPPRTR